MRLARQRTAETHSIQNALSEKELLRSAAIHYIELLISKTMAVPIQALRSRRRGNASVSFARHTAMYLAHVGMSYSLGEVSMAYGRDRSTVMYACRNVENVRDDPTFDALLDVLELELRNWRKHWDRI